MSWFSRVSKKNVSINALADMWSVLYPAKGSAIVTDARTGMSKSVWIYRAASTIATRVGSLPWHLYKGDKIAEGNDFFFKRPSPSMTGTEFFERIMLWQLLNGTGIVYAEKPLGLTVLDADRLRMDHGNLLYWDGTDRMLDQKRVVLFPNLSLSGHWGLSELQPILDTANMDESAKQVFNNQMASGGLLSGLFSTDVRLSSQELEAVKKAWEEKYGGIGKAGGVGFLGGGFKFQPLGISAADMKMLEVSNVTREEIGAAFGVPGIFLNDTESVDYSNALIQERTLYTNTVCPKADRLADRITVFLLPILGLKGLEFRFDYSGIEALQANKLERAQIDEIEIRSGKMTINEARIRDGEKPVAWGNVFWGSAMLVPISGSGYSEPATPSSEPAKTDSVPVAEQNRAKALHSPEARQLIAKAFLSRTEPEEKKFMQATMGVFHKQEKRVISWLNEQKAMTPKLPKEIFDIEEMLDEWRPLFLAFGMSSAEEIASRYSWATPDPSIIKKWINSRGAKYSKYVNETSNDEIMNILSEDRANGLGIPDMIKHIEGYFDVNAKSRAEVIARTQVIGVNNYAGVETYRANGVKQKEWLATNDSRVRDTHAEADGQVVGIDEPFIVGGSKLQYPGDPEGPPEEVCSCRCTSLPVI